MPQELLTPKPVSESAIHDQTSIVFPNDLNAFGTLFGGGVLELADKVAAVVAFRHSEQPCVTLGLDSVRFLAPAQHGDILVFQASVNRAWRTSMEVGVKVWAESRRHHQRTHIFSAYFTYVAVDEALQPVPVRPVLPQTEDELRRDAHAEQRRERRLQEFPKPPSQ